MLENQWSKIWTPYLLIGPQLNLSLLKSSSCRQDINVENYRDPKSGPLICSLDGTPISVSNLNIPQQHGRQQRLSSVSLPNSYTPTSSHTLDTAPKCVFRFVFQTIQPPAGNKGRKLGVQNLDPLFPHGTAAQSHSATSTSRSSTSAAPSGSPAAAPQHPHTAWTKQLIWLCKSSTCRQHLYAENKGSKVWTPYSH